MWFNTSQYPVPLLVLFGVGCFGWVVAWGAIVFVWGTGTDERGRRRRARRVVPSEAGPPGSSASG